MMSIQATPYTLLSLANQTVQQRAAVVAPCGLVIVDGLEHVRGTLLLLLLLLLFCFQYYILYVIVWIEVNFRINAAALFKIIVCIA